MYTEKHKPRNREELIDMVRKERPPCFTMSEHDARLITGGENKGDVYKWLMLVKEASSTEFWFTQLTGGPYMLVGDFTGMPESAKHAFERVLGALPH